MVVTAATTATGVATTTTTTATAKQFMVEYNIASQSVSWSVVYLVENDFGTTGGVCRDH